MHKIRKAFKVNDIEIQKTIAEHLYAIVNTIVNTWGPLIEIIDDKNALMDFAQNFYEGTNTKQYKNAANAILKNIDTLEQIRVALKQALNSPHYDEYETIKNANMRTRRRRKNLYDF